MVWGTRYYCTVPATVASSTSSAQAVLLARTTTTAARRPSCCRPCILVLRLSTSSGRAPRQATHHNHPSRI